MVNNRKIRLMARTAMYEDHEGKEDLKISKYYKNDYVGLHMITAGIATTVAFVLAIGLIIICNFENLIKNLTDLKYSVIFGIIILLYILFLIVYLIVAYFLYTYKFNESEFGIRFYQKRLKKINVINRKEKKLKEKAGGATVK